MSKPVIAFLWLCIGIFCGMLVGVAFTHKRYSEFTALEKQHKIEVLTATEQRDSAWKFAVDLDSEVENKTLTLFGTMCDQAISREKRLTTTMRQVLTNNNLTPLPAFGKSVLLVSRGNQKQTLNSAYGVAIEWAQDAKYGEFTTSDLTLVVSDRSGNIIKTEMLESQVGSTVMIAQGEHCYTATSSGLYAITITDISQLTEYLYSNNMQLADSNTTFPTASSSPIKLKGSGSIKTRVFSINHPHSVLKWTSTSDTFYISVFDATTNVLADSIIGQSRTGQSYWHQPGTYYIEAGPGNWEITIE